MATGFLGDVIKYDDRRANESALDASRDVAIMAAMKCFAHIRSSKQDTNRAYQKCNSTLSQILTRGGRSYGGAAETSNGSEHGKEGKVMKLKREQNSRRDEPQQNDHNCQPTPCLGIE
jgi:hypothetical protein